jgi:hypothetical protein
MLRSPNAWREIGVGSKRNGWNMASNSNVVTFGTAAAQAVAASQSQSTRDSASLAHRRKFLETFRRWELLFKRKDNGDVEAEKWLISEYYDSLRHLTAEGFDTLTRMLKERCTFFPTIRECIELTRCAPTDYGHPFYRANHLPSTQKTPLIAGSQPKTRHLLDAPR